MFQHDWLAAQLAQDHRRDLLHQAEQERLARQVKAKRTTRGHALYHVLDWTGRRLVKVGDQLQARHAAVHTRSVLHTSRG